MLLTLVIALYDVRTNKRRFLVVSESGKVKAVAPLGGRTAPGDTSRKGGGGDTRREKIVVGKFTKNSGQTRSER